MAAATTLQDFLVSVKYTVDGASQQNFLQSLTHATLSAKGLAAAIVGLTSALVKLSVSLAETGEHLYWMSMRMGSSVESIRATSFALSNLGISSDQAKQGMEGLAEWSARYGAAGSGFFKMIGVTATDTAGRYLQLAQVLRNMGGTYEFLHGTPEQTTQFARALALAQSFNISMQEMLAMTGDLERFTKVQKEVYGLVGLTEDKQQQAAKTAQEYMNAWRSVRLEFAAMRDAFSASLLEKLLPIMRHLFEIIEPHLPAIKRLLDGLATTISVFMNVMLGLVDVFSHVINGFEQIFGLLDRLGPGLNIAKDVLIGFGVALMRTPFGMWITALTFIAGLLEDFEVYQEGGKSVINWGMFGDTEIAGIKVNLADIALALASIAASMVLLRGGASLASILGGVVLGRGGAAAGAAGAAGGAAGAASTAAKGGRMGIIGPGLIVTAALAAADYFWGKAEEKGWDPGTHEHSFLGGYALGEKTRNWISNWWSGGKGGGGGGDGADIGQTPFGNLVSRGEGTYNSVNRGLAGGYQSGTEDLENKTISQVMADQAAQRYNAAGRYQIIRGTMKEAVAQMGLSGNEKFDRAMQDRIFSQFLAGSKRPALQAYLSGRSDDLHSAMVEASAEWASIANPDTGRSSYKNQRATISVAELSESLQRTRAINLAHGINRATSPGGAPDGSTALARGDGVDGGNQVTLNQHTTVNVNGAGNPHDTAQHVAMAQTRVNENMVRDTASVLR